MDWALQSSIIFISLLGICLSDSTLTSDVSEGTNSTNPIRVKLLTGKASNHTLANGTVDVFYQELSKQDIMDLMRVSVEIQDPSVYRKEDGSILEVSVSNGRDSFLLKLPVIYPNLTLYNYGKLLNPLLQDDFGPTKKRNHRHKDTMKQMLLVTVKSRLQENISYTLHVTRYDRSQYALKFEPRESRKILSDQKLTLVKPIGYFLDAKTENIDSFHITVTSDDDICANLITIPSDESLYDKRVDLDEVDNRRIVTFTRRADVFFSKSEIQMFKEFRIFAFVTPDDTSCGGTVSRKSILQNKIVTFDFAKLEDSSYTFPVTMMLLFLAAPVLIFGSSLALNLRRKVPSVETSAANLISISPDSTLQPSEVLVNVRDSPDTTIEFQQPQVIHDMEPQVTEHCDSLSLHGEMIRYPIAIILPVLMHTAVEYHKWTTSTMANRDEMCFHNHACARPYGELRAWNNIISNVGYAIYGALFVAITMFRRRRVKSSQGTHESTLIDVTIGVFMVLQAIASATYHICPSDVAFQFDTPCIQVICCLLIIRQWLVRIEPPAAAYSNILLVGVVSLNFLISALARTYYIRYLLAFIHTAVIIGVCYSKHIILKTAKTLNSRRISMYFTVFFTLANLTIMLMYITSSKIHLNQIATYCCILNCILYLIYYATLKKLCAEKIGRVAKFYGAIAIIGWLLAAFFFFQDDTDWTLSPAASRSLNKPCLLFDFFGSHDLWHIFGALAGLFTFLFVSIVDDDLFNTPKSAVQIF